MHINLLRYKRACESYYKQNPDIIPNERDFYRIEIRNTNMKERTAIGLDLIKLGRMMVNNIMKKDLIFSMTMYEDEM